MEAEPAEGGQLDGGKARAFRVSALDLGQLTARQHGKTGEVGDWVLRDVRDSRNREGVTTCRALPEPTQEIARLPCR
jgi:hypothetical protein